MGGTQLHLLHSSKADTQSVTSAPGSFNNQMVNEWIRAFTLVRVSEDNSRAIFSEWEMGVEAGPVRKLSAFSLKSNMIYTKWNASSGVEWQQKEPWKINPVDI